VKFHNYFRSAERLSDASRTDGDGECGGECSDGRDEDEHSDTSEEEEEAKLCFLQ
jgi:hypothetical protein